MPAPWFPRDVDFLGQLSLRETSVCDGGCLAGWKVGFAAILLAEGLLFGHTVFLLKRVSKVRSTFQNGLHFGHALSAGVFLAAGLLHILPEAVELMNGGEGHGDEHHEDDAHDEDGVDHVERQDHEDDEHGEGESEHGAGFPWAFFVVLVSFYSLFFLEKLFIPFLVKKSSAVRDEEKLDNEENSLESERNLHVPLLSKPIPEETGGFRSHYFLSGFVEIVGLSAHSLFESISLGLSGEFSTVLNVFIATASHRWATATAVAFKLAPHLNYLPFLTLLVVFSGAVPLGVGIGAALSSLPSKVQGVLFAISAGTFLYIGIFESMSEEFVVHRSMMFRKFLAMLAGAGIICVVTGILVASDVHG